MRIAHISDIHFRGLTRHEEYKQVFEWFVEDVKKKNVDIIFVGGDIVHSKTSGISPEIIDVLTWFFSKLAAVAPVHVILGNHDGNLVNLTRQDAVSPIINAMSSDRIFLYKKSGVYDLMPGFSLCVFSVFDVDSWQTLAPRKDVTNIGCYHGPLKGATTEEGWEIDSDLSVDDFKDYDFVLLGDIHARQNMAHRKCKDGISRPWIAYPGSPIQQNYGESVENHGYLLWDIKAKDEFDVDFVQLPNYNPYVTLDWENNPQEEAKKFPEKSRYRIRSQSHIPQKDARALTQWLQSRGALEVVFKIDQDRNRSVLMDESRKFVEDIRNIDALLEYMRKYAEHAGLALTPEDWTQVAKIVRSNVENLDFDNEISRHVRWTLQRAEWDNLFSYGEGNIVDFSKLNGIVGVFGSNRSGKSSLVGMLAYAMFNTSDRGPVKNVAIVNERKQYGVAKLDMSSTKGDYYLERQTVKKENRKGDVSAVTTLNFYSKASGDMADLNGEQRNDTEKVIRKFIGSFEDFAMTGLSRQGDLNSFINEGSTQRKTILSKFLDLDYLERLYDKVKIEMNNVKYSSKGLYENYDSKIETTSDRLVKASTSLVEKEDALEHARLKLEELKTKYASVSDGARPVTQEDVSAQELVFKRIETDLKEKRTILQTLTTEIKSLYEKKDKIELVGGEYDLDALKKQYNDQTALETEVEQRKATYQRDLDALNLKERSIKKLLEVPCGDQFPTCKYIKDSHKDKATIDSQRKKSQESLRLFDNVQRLLADLRKFDLKGKITKLEKLKEAHTTISVTVASKESTRSRTETESEQLSMRLLDASSKLDDLRAAANTDTSQACVKVKKDITNLQSKISQHDREVRLAYSEKGKLEHELDSLVIRKEECEKTLGLVKLYEFVTQSLSKKGIPALILRSQLPIINAEVEKILQGIVDFSVEFELDDDLNSMDIYLNYGEHRRLVELCSGMEKTIASIAIRVALVNMTSLPKPDFLIIDEGFGTLDPNEAVTAGRLLHSLKKFFRFVIVITHVDSLKDYVDNTIEISRKDKDSHVLYS